MLHTEDTAVRPISGALAHAIDAIAQLEGGIRLDEYMRRFVNFIVCCILLNLLQHLRVWLDGRL